MIRLKQYNTIQYNTTQYNTIQYNPPHPTPPTPSQSRDDNHTSAEDCYKITPINL